MTDYIRVFETSSEVESNKYIKKGWDLIDTSKAVNEIYGSSKLTYILGLSSKARVNQLLAIIRDYEKYGLKEALIKKVEEETGDKIASYQTEDSNDRVYASTPLTKYVTNYEDIVNSKKVSFYKLIEDEDIGKIEW